jgi:hypothetical protein
LNIKELCCSDCDYIVLHLLLYTQIASEKKSCNKHLIFLSFSTDCGGRRLSIGEEGIRNSSLGLSVQFNDSSHVIKRKRYSNKCSVPPNTLSLSLFIKKKQVSQNGFIAGIVMGSPRFLKRH